MHHIIWEDGSTSKQVLCIINDTVLKAWGTLNGCTTNIDILSAQNLIHTFIFGPVLGLNSTITLTANGANSYQWNDISGSTTTSISISPFFKTKYQVIGTATNGCSAMDTLTVNVNPLPTINISAPTSVCYGDAAALVASGANSYIWNGLIPSAEYNPIITKDSTFSVLGTDINGCQNTASKTITKLDLPQLSFTGEDEICYGESTRITVSGANSYSWDGGATGSSILITPKQDTVLTVTGYMQGCYSTLTIPIIVKPLPLFTYQVITLFV